MNRNMFILVLILGFGLARTAAANDTLAAVDQWYFSPMIGVGFEDKDRLADNGIAGSLGLGKQLTPQWALEFSLFGGKHGGYNEFNPMGIGVDLIRNLSASGNVTPYVVFGTGWIRPDIVEFNDNSPELDYDNFMANLGLGMVKKMGSSATRFRGELRYRRDLHNPSFSDFLVMGGLYRPFGAQTASSRMTLPDGDGDGVADDVDVCPATPAGTEVDKYGCEVDSDGDGVANSKDRCPTTPSGTKVDSRGCRIQMDSDGDGVSDSNDKCPGTPRSAKVNAAGCELDSDGDGVVNSLDRCPDTVKGVRVDVRGCEISVKIDLPNVRFELESANLVAETTAILDEAAETLRRNPDLQVESAGYTDSTGDAAYNLDLSQRRAESVRLYLISKGANGDNISARGYGEANPVFDNSTRPGRQKNRRVELRVLN